ncbi:MAG: PKD domain-containing protein, partial [Rhodothermales bacterium]
MISAHDGGLSYTGDAAGQHRWRFLNKGYTTTQFNSVAVSELAGSPVVIGGLQDNGTWMTNSSDPSKPWIQLGSGDGGYAAISPLEDAYYVSSQLGNIWRWEVRGGDRSSFSNVTPADARDFLFVAPFELSSEAMYLAAGNTIWYNERLDRIRRDNSEPARTGWVRLGRSALESGSYVTAVAAGSYGRLYFGGMHAEGGTTVLKRVDGARDDPEGTIITPPVTQGAYPASIAVNRADRDEILAVFSNYRIESVWHSTDGGDTWRNAGGVVGGVNGPSIRWAAIVPAAAGPVYFLATSTGIFSTTAIQGSDTIWAAEAGETVGNVVVDMIRARLSDGLVVAATHGRGVYSARLHMPEGRSPVAEVDERNLHVTATNEGMGAASITLANRGGALMTYSASAAISFSTQSPSAGKLSAPFQSGDPPSSSSNEPPMPTISSHLRYHRVGDAVTFDGSRSYDLDGTIVAHHWSFGDGAESARPIDEHMYREPGGYTVSLTVTDDDGADGSTSEMVLVTDRDRFVISPASGLLPPG